MRSRLVVDPGQPVLRTLAVTSGVLINMDTSQELDALGLFVVQTVLFQAYRKLETFADGRPLQPRLFRASPTIGASISYGGAKCLGRRRGSRG